MKHYEDEKNFMLTDSIGFLINRASNDLSNEVDRALKDFGLTGHQMAILLALEANLAATPFELARLGGVDPGLMSRLLDKLEERGFLERSRSVEDRRVVNLTLTPHGHDVATRYRQLRRLLRKFVGN